MDVGPHHPSLKLDAEKKSLIAAERDDAQRAAFQARLTQRAAGDFVIVDETGSNLNLTPRYARAPRGQRAYGTVPRNTPPTTTLIAAMSTAGMGAAMVLDGATDTAAFEAYVQQVLAPTLQPGQVVVLDNLSAHKSPRIRTAIEACGCALWSLARVLTGSVADRGSVRQTQASVAPGGGAHESCVARCHRRCFNADYGN
jgi:hypothetical protein